MILSQNQRDAILSVKLNALPDLYRLPASGPDAVTQSMLRGVWSTAASGNALAAVQQVIAAADRRVGFAPWQAPAVLALADIPTSVIAAGRLLIEGLAAQLRDALASLAENVIKKALKEVANEALEASLKLLTAFPMAGWVVDLVLGLVFAVVDLIKLANASEQAQQAEDTVRPALPDPNLEKVMVEGLLTKLETTADWTAVWLPVADPSDPLNDWVDGFGCALIEPDGPYADGRRIDILGWTAWKLDNPDHRGFGDRGALGFGAMPGGRIFRTLQCDSKVENIINAGSWWTIADSAASSAWSLMFADGPAVFAADSDQIRVAWSRYIGKLVESLDSGDLCNKMSAAQRRRIRDYVVEYVGAQDGPPEVVAETCAPVLAAAELGQFQRAAAESTTVAYTNAREVPPALEELVRRGQESLLESNLICSVDTTAIPDAVFRARAELAKSNKGAQCYMAQNIGASGAQFLGSRPKPPRAADPTRRSPPSPLGSSAPRAPTTPARAPSSGDGGGGAGLGLLAAITLGLALYLAPKRPGGR